MTADPISRARLEVSAAAFRKAMADLPNRSVEEVMKRTTELLSRNVQEKRKAA